MLVFWKEKLVFLAVPKTGTTAYEAALGSRASMVVNDPPELKHAPIYRYNRFFRPMLEKFGGGGFETLAVMREPVSWLGSWYRYRQRDFLDGSEKSTKGLTFDDFIGAYCQDDRPAFASVGSQYNFLKPRPNGLRVDHLFRYEDQPLLIAFLEERLGMRLDLPRRNVSPDAPLELSHERRAQLTHLLADDFALWNEIARQA